MVRTRSPVRIWLSAPKKTSLTTRDVFFGAGGHLRQKHSQQRGVLFLPLCFIFLKKHVQKLGLKLSSVGLFSINTLTFGVFFCKVLCLPLMCFQKRPTLRNRAFLFFAICFNVLHGVLAKAFCCSVSFKFSNGKLFPKHIDSSVMSYYNHFVTMHKHVASK